MIHRRDALVAASVLVVGIAFRIPTLGQPLLEAQGFRQTQTAYQALLYQQEGIDLLHPKVPVLGSPFEIPFELPLFEAFASVPMRILAPDQALRTTALACFLVAAVLLWRLVRQYRGEPAALATLVAFLFSPFDVLWSRAALIEYLVVAASLAYLLAGITWRDERRVWQWLVALAAGIVAMTVKITSGFVWVLPLVAYDSRRGRQNARDPALLSLVALPLAAGLAWTRYADAVRAAGPGTAWMTSAGLAEFLFGPILERLDPGAWFFLLVVAIGLVVGPVVIGTLVASRYALRDGPHRGLWISLVLAPLVSIVVFFNLYRVHDYYSASLTPSLAVAVGLGAARLWQRSDVVRASLPVFVMLMLMALLALPPGWALATIIAATVLAATVWQLGRTGRVGRRPLLIVIAVVGVAGNLAVTSAYWRLAYASDTETDRDGVLPRAAELARLTTPHELALIVGHDWSPDLLYYARRRGQMLPEPLLRPAFVDALDLGRYPVFMAWDPLGDPLWPVARASWIGSIGAHTWSLATEPAALRGARIVATDDTSAIASLSAGRRLSAEPMTLICDQEVTLPRGSSGTWLQLDSAPADARIRVTDDLAPAPARHAVFIAQELEPRVRCVGADKLRIASIVDAPPPR